MENRIIIIPWHSAPLVHHTEIALYSLQHYVGGYIEPCAPAELREQGIELLADEEGVLKGLPLNPNLYPFFFVGNLVMVGVGDEYYTGLTDDQIEYAMKWLANLD